MPTEVSKALCGHIFCLFSQFPLNFHTMCFPPRSSILKLRRNAIELAGSDSSCTEQVYRKENAIDRNKIHSALRAYRKGGKGHLYRKLLCGQHS